MRRLLALALCASAAACGGAPFSTARVLEDLVVDGGTDPGSDGAVLESGPAPLEAGADAPEDAGAPDALVDGGGVDADPVDAGGHDADAAGGVDAGHEAGKCTPLPLQQFPCGTPENTACILANGEACSVSSSGLGQCVIVPAACQCIETYTCACAAGGAACTKTDAGTLIIERTGP